MNPNHTHTMDDQEKHNFKCFIRILTDTGNMQHAITESGWTDQTSPTDGSDAVDLSTVSRDQLQNHIGSSVALPAPIQSYVEGSDGPLSTQERHAIADALEKHYQLAPKFCIIDTTDGDFYLELDNE